MTVLPSQKNPALVVTADQKIKLVEAPINEPGDGEVLIHVKCTGVCGSDIHFWKAGAIGDLRVEGDCILGHESAGVVVKAGPNVNNVQEGDRVAIEPGVPCEQCYLCLQGDYNLCQDVEFAGVYPYDGALQRYKVHRAKYVYRIPENMTYGQGALIEPLSVVLHGVERAQLKIGRGCLVTGAGPIGLIALEVARASGATPLVITDLSQERLAFAKKIVPQCTTYQINPKKEPKDTAQEIRELFGPTEYDAPDCVLECTGVPSSIITACYSARRSGSVMAIGVGKDKLDNLPFMHISLAEIDLKFINRYHGTWPVAIKLLSQGVINIDKLITHTYPLEEAIEALTLASDTNNGSIKVQVEDS